MIAKVCDRESRRGTWFENRLVSNFARFCTPKRCTRVQCLDRKNNPNYVNFWTSLIPP